MTGRGKRGLVCHRVPGIILTMRLSRKFRKLFSREVLESFWEHAARRMHPVNERRILATINCAEFARLRERHPHRAGSLRINRFEDAHYWVGINVERAQDLWLDRTPALILAFVLSAIVLFGVGVYSAVTLVGDWRKSGLKMLVIGLGAAGLGFLIGHLFHAAGA